MGSEEMRRRAEAYPELVNMLSTLGRSHLYNQRYPHSPVTHSEACEACRVEDLLDRLGET